MTIFLPVKRARSVRDQAAAFRPRISAVVLRVVCSERTELTAAGPAGPVLPRSPSRGLCRCPPSPPPASAPLPQPAASDGAFAQEGTLQAGVTWLNRPTEPLGGARLLGAAAAALALAVLWVCAEETREKMRRRCGKEVLTILRRNTSPCPES